VDKTRYFDTLRTFTGSWEDYFILAALIVMALLAVVMFAERGKHQSNMHSPGLAWMRGGLYFCFAYIFSWTTGVLSTVVHSPLATRAELQEPGWIALMLFCSAVAIWSYCFWWPRGTLTHGRKLYFLPTIVFGLLWGISVGLIHLSVFAIVEEFGFSRWVTALLVYALLSAYSLNIQLGWWDIYVSPPHNIRATNSGKVLFAHTPFLISTLTFFTIYGNAGIFVLFSGFAMAACAIAMRFPPFWQSDGGPVSRETAIGV
jgi:hypothetical protein